MPYNLSVDYHFDAAHFLKGYPGKCANEHGHRWEVTVEFAGEKLDKLNMLVDFGIVKHTLKDLLDTNFDHTQLNEALFEECPTAEFLAKWIYDHMTLPVSDEQLKDLHLISVTVNESPECAVTYYKEDVE